MEPDTENDRSDGSASTPEELRNQEESDSPGGEADRDLAGQEAEAGSSPPAEAGSSDSGSNTTEPQAQQQSEEDNKKKQGRLGRLRALGSRIGVKGAVIAGGITSVMGIVGVLALLFFLASLLKIPNLTDHIIEYQGARLIRQFGESVNRTAQESLAVESATDDPEAGAPKGLRGLLQEKYQGLRDNTWGKLDRFRPGIQIKNLQTNNGLVINTRNSIFGNTILRGVTLNNTTYLVRQTGGIARFVPVLNQLTQFKNNVDFSRNFVPQLKDSLKANDIGPVIRFLVARRIRQQIGIGLIAWHLGKYQGLNQEQADLAEDREVYDQVAQPESQGPAANERVQQLSDAEQAAEQQTTQDVANDTALKEIQQNGGIDKSAIQAILNIVGDSPLKTVVGFLSPAYAIALPACIVYEGSLDDSGPQINQQTQAQERAFYFLATAADQQKGGDPNGTDKSGYGLTEAIGAMNDKLGDITQSNAEIRANGGTINTQNSALSAESSPTGQFTLIDATPGLAGTGAGDAIKNLANGVCPVLSNVWVGLGTGVLIQIGTIIASIFTAGGAEIGEQATSAAIDGTVDEAATSFTQRFVDAIAQQFAGKSVGDYVAKARELVGDGFKSTVQLSALTILAKLLVMARASGLFNGLEQGADFANEADSGANIHMGELERQQLFGRPLTAAEVSQSDQADSKFIGLQNQSRSFTDRYFAISNPDSLISHMAVAVNGEFNGSLLKPFGNALTNLLSGPISFGSMARSVSAVTHASSADQHYGNIQFGWSEDEEGFLDTLIGDGNYGYTMLQNQQTLDQSGKEDEIAQKYAQCFGYQYSSGGDGSLDPTDGNGNLQSDITTDGSIGTLLSTGAIVRDSFGDVVADQGLCSPLNLGRHNPQYGDLVFRWRVAEQYQTTLALGNAIQTLN